MGSVGKSNAAQIVKHSRAPSLFSSCSLAAQPVCELHLNTHSARRLRSEEEENEEEQQSEGAKRPKAIEVGAYDRNTRPWSVSPLVLWCPPGLRHCARSEGQQSPAACMRSRSGRGGRAVARTRSPRRARISNARVSKPRGAAPALSAVHGPMLHGPCVVVQLCGRDRKEAVHGIGTAAEDPGAGPVALADALLPNVERRELTCSRVMPDEHTAGERVSVARTCASHVLNATGAPGEWSGTHRQR